MRTRRKNKYLKATSLINFVLGALIFSAFSLAPNKVYACQQCEASISSPAYYCQTYDQGAVICVLDASQDTCTLHGACNSIISSSRNNLLKSQGRSNTCLSKPAIANTATSASEKFHRGLSFTPAQIAISRQTNAEFYIDQMLNTESANQAHFLHTIMSSEKPDIPWSEDVTRFIKTNLASAPNNLSSRLLFLGVKCGSTICELSAAAMNLSGNQRVGDVKEWQQQNLKMMQQKEWRSLGFDPSNFTLILSSTPDGRPIFVSYFVRDVRPN